MKFWTHYDKVDGKDWPWRDFSPEEIASKDDGSLRIEESAMNRLQGLRDIVGAPMLVTSGYRSPAHNRAVGGVEDSRHLRGEAFDIAMANHDPAEFEALAREMGFTGFGFYPDKGFMHIDEGPPREWGTRFAPRTNRFAAQEGPGPKRRDAEVTGGGVALGAGAGGAAIEAARGQLAEAQGLIGAGALQSDILRWALLGLVLGGAALALWSRLRKRKGLGD